MRTINRDLWGHLFIKCSAKANKWNRFLYGSNYSMINNAHR